MVRSRWIKAVMATVVSTGLAWGQSAVPTPTPAPDDPTGRIITVNEAGKPPQKCRVVKASVDEKGRKVLQVECLTTGEVMTIVTEGAPTMGEPAAPGRAKTLKTQIFHWGKDHTPPAVACEGGCAPSDHAIVSTTPCPTCTPSAGNWSAPSVANCDTCKPSSGSWTAPTSTGGPAITSNGQSATTVGPTVTTSGQPVPAPQIVTTTPKETVVVTTPAKPAETKVTKPEPTLLDKWRESWGKSDKPKAPATDTVKTTEPKKPAADTTKPPEPKKPATEVVKTPEPKPAPLPDLPHVDTKKPDPLLGDPTQYSKRPIDQKLPPKGEVPHTDLSKLPGAAPSAPGGGEPLGAGMKSITDSGAVTKAPYPVATLPPVNMGPQPRPPVPMWNVPQAPNPVNPGRGSALEGNQGGIAYNAFTPYEQTPPAPGTPGQSMLGNAFSNDYDPKPAGGVFGPSGPPPMMPPAGYGPMMGGGGMLPTAPYGPVVRMQGTPGPNPMAQGPQLAMLPHNNGVMQTGYQAPATSAVSGMGAPQLTTMLHESLYPSQREWAADKLSALDWKQNDAAVQALAKGVHEDPAPTVRAACIRALARMKADSYMVVSAVQAAKADSDVRVRNEATEALGVLAPGTTAPAPLSPAVQPAAVVTPPAPTAPAKPAPAPTGTPALPALPN